MLKKITGLVVVVGLAAACGTRADEPNNAAAGPSESTGSAAETTSTTAAPVGAETSTTGVTDTTAPALAAAPAAVPAAGRARPTTRSAAAPSPQAGPAGAGPVAEAAPGGSAAGPAQPAPGAGAPAFAGKVPGKGQGFSDDTIKIGATFPLSGAIAFLGQESVGAMDAYVKMLNARGGVQGRKLQLISYDDGFDPGQIVANVKRLWEQDKVSMVFQFLGDSANDYAKEKNIPLFTFGGSPGSFASKYPTIIPVGGSLLTWGQQVAIAVTKHMNRHPKIVAVMTDSSVLNTHSTAKYLEDYWRKLGATQVIVEPVNLSQGDCSQQVLKYRQAGVEYWDWQSFGFLLCMPAQERLGWKPPLGQGGPLASISSLSSTIGKSMEGVIAGSPADLFDGRPRFTGPTRAHAEYVEAIRRYQPSLSSPEHLNSPPQLAYWLAAKLVFDGAINGAAEKFKELSSASILKWIHEVKDYDVGISTPIRGFAPNCKQGNNTTWWGTWKWDEGTQKLVSTPVTPYVDNSWYTDDPCFMTKVADEVTK